MSEFIKGLMDYYSFMLAFEINWYEVGAFVAIGSVVGALVLIAIIVGFLLD
jgi:hypothetical protein